MAHAAIGCVVTYLLLTDHPVMAPIIFIVGVVVCVIGEHALERR